MNDVSQRLATIPIEVDDVGIAHVQPNMPLISEWIAQARLGKEGGKSDVYGCECQGFL